MYVSEATLRSAKTICSLSNWKLSNLPLQKLLYLSHMIALGEKNLWLVGSNFQAWDLGPVEPNLYHKVKAYGDNPIPDIFNVPEYPPNSPEREIINRVVSELRDATPGKLVAITHQAWGAWAAHYRPRVMGIEIPEHEIRREYANRLQRSRAKRDVHA
jgi:uncharacterized phage-associated protein